MSIQPSGKHRATGPSRRQWFRALQVLAVAVLVGAGLYIALRLPIGTPTGAPAGYTNPSAADLRAAEPVPPPALAATTAVGTPANIPTAAADPTTTAPPVAADTRPGPGRTAAPVATGPSSTPCQPARFALSDLGIDAGVVRLELTPAGDLGTPRDADKTRAGWFPSVLAGSARGTVLMDGHTYHDNSALFTMTFERQVRTGMVIALSCSDGHTFRYRIAEVIPDLDPAGFRTVVESRALYAPDGPPQLVMITCTDYNPATRVWEHRVVLVATPVG